MTEHTEVRERRYSDLSEALAAALVDCAQHELARAAAMADTLDTACLDFIAHNERCDFIEMPLPAQSMGQLLNGLDHIPAVRRLIELGALRIVSEPYIGYGWTYDGHLMIERINAVHPQAGEEGKYVSPYDEAAV